MKKYKYNKSAGGLFNGNKEINTQPNKPLLSLNNNKVNKFINNIKSSTTNSSINSTINNTKINTKNSSGLSTEELKTQYNSLKKKFNLKYFLIIILILVIMYSNICHYLLCILQ